MAYLALLTKAVNNKWPEREIVLIMCSQ